MLFGFQDLRVECFSRKPSLGAPSQCAARYLAASVLKTLQSNLSVDHIASSLKVGAEWNLVAAST